MQLVRSTVLERLYSVGVIPLLSDATRDTLRSGFCCLDKTLIGFSATFREEEYNEACPTSPAPG